MGNILAAGTFIVIEDAGEVSGQVQLDLLADKLKREGYEVALFTFPQHERPSSFFVRQYLDGAYGEPELVGPYTASMLYALDRFHAAPAIRRVLDNGGVVLATGFIGLTMAKLGSLLSNAEVRRGYFLWADTVDFQTFKIPRPDKTFVIKSQSIVAQKTSVNTDKNTPDKNNRNLLVSQQEKIAEVFDDICQLFPKDFTRIDRLRGKKMMSDEGVHELLWKSVETILPQPRQAVTKPATDISEVIDYFIPQTLNEEAKSVYKHILDNILALRKDIKHDLISSSGVTPQEIAAAIDSLLPVATEPSIIKQPSEQDQLAVQRTKKVLSKLPSTYSSEDTSSVVLQDFWPRNELAALPMVLYKESSLSLTALQKEVDSWTYEQKAKTFQMLLQDFAKENGNGMPIQYTWDLLTDYATFASVKKKVPDVSTENQPLTPRYGYATPPLIERLGLADKFETCFDLSLKLYSQLQSHGYDHEAQYATLLGHRMRWKATFGAYDIQMRLILSADQNSYPSIRQLCSTMLERIAEVHPLLADYITSLSHNKNPGLYRLAAKDQQIPLNTKAKGRLPGLI